MTKNEQNGDESVSCAAEFYLNAERGPTYGNVDDEARLTNSTKCVEPPDIAKTKGELLKRSVHTRVITTAVRCLFNLLVNIKYIYVYIFFNSV